MNFILTGASSFTGYWFSKCLAERGHRVTAIFPREEKSYQGIRKERVKHVCTWTTPVFGASFGDPLFLKTVLTHPVDLFCHHGAYVADYKSPSFDFALALSQNTQQIENVLRSLKDKGCEKILLTGSVFEQREGGGERSHLPVSPYGLSKGLTSDVFAYFAHALNFKLGKFVIPNPFGPYEEGRLTTYLAKQWLQKEVPEIAFPDYIRDNIFSSLLAKAYAFFAESLDDGSKFQTFRPSGYVEAQGVFVKRFSEEMEKRLGVKCPFRLKKQTHFSEPFFRTNSTHLDPDHYAWCESDAWDLLATYYLSTLRS